MKNVKIGICKWCKKEKKINGKEICNWCYRRLFWKQKLKECKRCKRMLPNQAKGYCPGCYSYVFHLEGTKAGQRKRLHNIDNETYKRITTKCFICGFDKVVDLHHLDNDHKNNSESNMIGLCPNHHKMLHNFKYKDEILAQIKEKRPPS